MILKQKGKKYFTGFLGFAPFKISMKMGNFDEFYDISETWKKSQDIWKNMSP